MKLEKLRELCTAPINSFESLGDVCRGPSGTHVFIDNGADVLMTAHLDTVASRKQCRQFTVSKKGIVRSRALDDRLGVYILLDVLPTLDVNVDVLLTEGEEGGQSTARDFTTEKNYNWLGCFDREGGDIVTYNYHNLEAEKTLQEMGFTMGWGSYTDICELEWMGIWGMNVGTGYHRHHYEDAWADLKVTHECIMGFKDFWEAYHETPLWNEGDRRDKQEKKENYIYNSLDWWNEEDRLTRGEEDFWKDYHETSSEDEEDREGWNWLDRTLLYPTS